MTTNNLPFTSDTGFSTTGNVTAGNVVTCGAVSATGNVYGQYLIGNLRYATSPPPAFGCTIAIGTGTGNGQQGYAVAIGANAGNLNQSGYAVAIGACTGGGNNAFNNSVSTTAGSPLVNILGTTTGLWKDGQTMTSPASVSGAKIVESRVKTGGACAGHGYVVLSQNATATISGAIGAATGYQQANAIAIGRSAGGQNQNACSVAIGQLAGGSGQCANSVAVGGYAGRVHQSNNAVAVGQSAGSYRQSSGAVALGAKAGNTSQGAKSIAIGCTAGASYYASSPTSYSAGTGLWTIETCGVTPDTYLPGMAYSGNPVIFNNMGYPPIYITNVYANNKFSTSRSPCTNVSGVTGPWVRGSGSNAIAIGASAGNAQGNSSIAVGANAGGLLADNSIVINATGANLTSNVANALFVAPIRSVCAAGGSPAIVGYCTTTKEIVYGLAGGSSYGDANVTTLLSSGTVSTDYVTSGNVSATGNVYGGNILSDNYFYANGVPFVSNNYGDTNVEILLASGTITTNILTTASVSAQGNVCGANINTTGNVSVAGNIYGNLLGSATTITCAAQPNITSVGLLNALTVNGNIVVTGNANVQGTLTYNNINQLTTSNLVLGLGNNQTGINVTGGGIEVGQTGEASLFYCQPNHVWDSNIGISAVGNILSGRTISAVGNILSGGAITAIGNISGNFFIGNGSLLTGLTATPTFGNTIAIGTGTGNAQGTFAVAIGVNAGFNSQQGYAVAIGACTGGGNNAYNSNVVTFAGSTFVSVVGAINTNFTWQPGQTMTAPPTVVGAKIVRTFINNSGSGQGRLELSQPATGNSSGIAGTAVGHQQGYAVAIGGGAGSLNQCTNSIAIGHCAGATGQCNNSIAIGAQAGSEKQGANSVAVGRGAGNWRQSSGAVAIGTGAGAVYQGANAIAIGFSSGNGVSATANATIVRQCGASTNRFSLTGTGSVGPLYAGMQFIGNPLAFSTPSLCTPVYITCVAGNNTFTTNYIGQTINAFKYNFVKNTGQKSIAIGACAGNAIGNSSIAIGAGAGNLFLANNSIVINATGANLTSNVANALFVAPVRCATVAGGSPVGLGYCTTTKEVVYGVGGGGGGCYGNSNVATYLASGTVSTGILTTVGISAQGGLAFGALNNCIHCECGAIISSPMGILLQSCNLGTSALLFNNQLSVTGNIIGTNLNTTGLVSATGNVYGCNVVGTYLYGCGANITGISSNSISNGTSNVSIATANGAITMAVNGTSAGKIDLSRVAIGHMAGECSQGPGAIAIGDSAGTVNQAGCAVAIGSLTAGGSNASNDNVSTTTGSSIVKLTGTTTGAWQVGQTMTTPAAVVGAKVIRYIDNPFTGSFLILSKNATATVAGVVGSATGYQQANTVAVGTQAGSQNQNVCSVAIGVGAGQLGQLCKAIAIGTSAGQSVQGTNSIAIGCGAGQLCQQTKAIAVGTKAGSILQGQGSIAIGCGAGGGIESLFTASLNPCSSCWTWYGGCTSEVVPTPGMILTSLPPCNSVTTWPFNTYPVTITSYCQSPCGPSFGGTFTTDAISGPQCGIPYCGVWPFIKGTGANAIAIGTNAGNAQGNNSIAIGHAAGNYLLGNNSIVINATGANLTSGCGVSCALYIAPIRSAVVAGGSPLGVGYCITTKEIVYDPASARAAVYDAATARGITGTAGQMIAITNSPVHAGRIAYWDLTNTRWSYISDNTAV